jgi:hypothetical protein
LPLWRFGRTYPHLRAEGVPVDAQVLDLFGQIAQKLNLKDRLEN